MSIRNQLTVSVLILGLGAWGGAAWAQTATHEDHQASQLQLTLNAGAKWQGDQNMIKGMNGINGAVAARLPAAHASTLPPADYKALASEIQTQVDFMVENCKLLPEVDEQFHIVLGQILEGVSELQGEVEPHRGMASIVQALNAYGTHFDHPNWPSL